MKTEKYDIFISYRRDGGAQYARILQLMLAQRGYRVFLDYDELRDGVFGKRIKAAIHEAPIFMLVLSEGAMERCANADDWVREEILLAIQEQKNFIPINPDKKFNGIKADVPEAIHNVACEIQHSEIDFGQALGVTIDLMIQDRIVPKIGTRQQEGHVDDDYKGAKETLLKIDRRNCIMKWFTIIGVTIVVLAVLGECAWLVRHHIDKDRIETEKASLQQLRTDIQERHKQFALQLRPDLTAEQMRTIDTLLTNMATVRPDTLWMSQFEFTVGQWYSIKDTLFDESQSHMPKTNVSYGDIYMLLHELGNPSETNPTPMTNLMIGLPSAEEWEYAAHGGSYHETTLYAGSDKADEVAWYQDNSNGHPHPSDGQQGLAPNWLDLFDMSGNVSELCNTAYDQKGLFTLCGGNYNSPSTDVTISSRQGFDTNAKSPTVGFRIVIRKKTIE